MSGSVNNVEGGNIFASVGLDGAGAGSELMKMLAAEDILPGNAPSYELCKIIYCYHPLGAKIVESPLRLAMSQAREITVAAGPEQKLVEAFRREWLVVGGRDTNGSDVSADTMILNVMSTARIYGIASLIVGERGKSNQKEPLDIKGIADDDIYFNVLDPLNTAGSLVLDQDPNSPEFQKSQAIRVGSIFYHPSRAITMMNERPVYIQFTLSAYGFVGRSAYQRALYPLKTFLQTMITDQYVAIKVGLLVAKMKTPGSVVNNRILNFFGFKREQLKGGATGNVLGIGTEEEIASLNFQNLEGPAAMVRDNALKNIAMAAGVPAKLLQQEEMVGGMAEGSEDAKQIAKFIDTVRDEMAPLYRFFDRIVMRRAWSPEFYKTVQKELPDDYSGVPYETAFFKWANSFKAKWPNLLEEPESAKMKAEEIRFKSAVALVETALPAVDPVNKANFMQWLVDEVNARPDLFSSKLEFDFDEMKDYVPPTPMTGEGKEPQPKPFGANT